MSKFGIACLGCLGILVIMAISFIGTAVGMYNSLINMNEKVTASWAAVETSYQRRFDLIPGLVEAVKGSMRQEQAVFGAIAEARTHYANAKTSEEKVGATQQYESALARLEYADDPKTTADAAPPTDREMADMWTTVNNLTAELRDLGKKMTLMYTHLNNLEEAVRTLESKVEGIDCDTRDRLNDLEAKTRGYRLPLHADERYDE